MPDFDDSLSPRDPEIEYPCDCRAGGDGYYGTGSTTPPKDHVGVISLVLVLFISFSSAISLLSLMNIEVFAQPEATEPRSQVSFTVSAEGVLTAQLEEVPVTTAPPAEKQPALDANLQLSAVPGTMENIPGETGTASAALSWQAVYEKLIPSVVSITCRSGGTETGGAGVVMDARGYIITNAHLVEKADTVRVLLTDGRELDAKCIGMDMVTDLAVLRVEATDLTAAEFGDSAALRVGDPVVAIGDPLGVELRGTMTDGIISGINRDVKSGGRTLTLLQTTAVLGAGSSGGPLVNCYGQVIGISTVKDVDYAGGSSVEGLGFAIPMSTVQTVVQQLASQGYVTGLPSLGLEGKSVSAFYQIYYSLPAGVMVTQVTTGTSAAHLGIERGDILLRLDGVRITGAEHMEEILYGHSVGDTLEAVFFTDGREIACTLTVTEEQG